jgi:hypothetical protein
MRNHIRACAAALALLPASLTAQMAVEPARGTRATSVDLSDGEPISWFLEFSQQLRLTPDQKTSLISIRRKLRSDNDRFMERLDSVAKEVGLTLGEHGGRLTGDERFALQRFNKITQPTRDSIKANNDIARAEALTLLNAAQTARLDSIMVLMRRGRGQERRGGGAGEGGGGS